MQLLKLVYFLHDRQVKSASLKTLNLLGRKFYHWSHRLSKGLTGTEVKTSRLCTGTPKFMAAKSLMRSSCCKPLAQALLLSSGITYLVVNEFIVQIIIYYIYRSNDLLMTLYSPFYFISYKSQTITCNLYDFCNIISNAHLI